MAANEVPNRRSCGTMEVHERLLRTVPDYADARSESETRAWRLATGRALLARTGVTLIPIVVHVVYKTATQNITDQQVQSQIDVLNRDYRKTNPDAASTPAVFQPLVADARVEFQLATTDPQGGATNGITRTQTQTASFGTDDKVKASATGGADPWPSDKYLNVWVCQLGGGLLGYAQFPGGPSDTDGVVILHSGFGSTGTAAAPFNLGRTATHEIGHWLNLRHIWGDDGTGCNGDDFVADTPNAAGPNYGTPTFPSVTCNNGPNGDLFMNYMDYVDDAAMFMFTNGQVGRMQACLDGDRSTIGTTQPGPTLKFADEPGPTLKFADEPGPTLKFRDEPGPTIKFADEPGPTLKFRDEPGPTFKFVDEPIGTLKFIDEVKQPFLDKPPLSDSPKGPADVGFPVNPAAPFVLATPHHSMAWTQAFPEAQRAAASANEAQIQQYEQLLEQYAQAERAGQLGAADRAAGDALYGDYIRLLGEYQRMMGS